MGIYIIYIGKKSFTVSGIEAAFRAYAEIGQLAAAIGDEAMLVSNEAGEVIAATDLD